MALPIPGLGLGERTCEIGGGPEGTPFRTKPRLALEILTELTAEGTLPIRWMTCDEGFGRNRAFLDSVVNQLSLYRRH